MKPTSVIFLIVAILLACVGFLLCMTATSLATEQGIGLFSQVGDADDNYVHTEYFTEEELKKIVIKVSDVNVNIIGGAEESRIELVNFLNSSYQVQIGRSTLQISDNAGISGIIDIENFQINFSGFRDYLHYIFDRTEKEKALNVYLTDEVDLVNFNITSDTGDITVSGLSTDCDYKIVIESGVVTFIDVSTDSSVQIESTKSSNIDIKNVSVDELRIMSPESECYINISETTFSRAMYVEAKSGDIVYDRVEDDFAGLDVRFEAEGNTISVFGENYSDLFVEYNASIDDTQPADPSDETASPAEDTSEPSVDDPEESTSDDEETTAPEDVGDLEDETDDSTVTIPANSLTIIIADGKIEVK